MRSRQAIPFVRIQLLKIIYQNTPHDLICQNKFINNLKLGINNNPASSDLFSLPPTNPEPAAQQASPFDLDGLGSTLPEPISTQPIAQVIISFWFINMIHTFKYYI